jgi:hypothetical protein
MSTEVVKNKKNEVALDGAEEIFANAVKNCHEISAMANTAIKSIKLGKGIMELRSALDNPEITNLIMSFQNNGLGFLTDNRNNGYAPPIVKDCALEALTAGAFLHGNEFNIIAGRCYFAQNFFVRMVREYCTLHKIKRHFTYIEKKTGAEGKQSRWEVKAHITWKLPTDQEKQTSIETYNLVGVSSDQVIGKAKKRAHQWLYNELTNNNFIAVPDTDYDIDMDDISKTEKPEANTNPDIVQYLIDKFGAPNVSGCLKDMGVMQANQSFDDLKKDEQAISSLIAGRESFEKEIEAFSNI